MGVRHGSATAASILSILDPNRGGPSEDNVFSPEFKGRGAMARQRTQSPGPRCTHLIKSKCAILVYNHQGPVF